MSASKVRLQSLAQGPASSSKAAGGNGSLSLTLRPLFLWLNHLLPASCKNPFDHMGPIWIVQDDYLKTMNLMTSAKSLLSGEALYSQFLGIKL